MFLMVLVFSVVLVLSFGVMLLMTRPTSTERTIEGRIAKLQAAQNVATPLDDAPSKPKTPGRLPASWPAAWSLA